MGDFEETANWHTDDKGDILMGEQTASLDDAGNLVAELNGMLVRFEKKQLDGEQATAFCDTVGDCVFAVFCCKQFLHTLAQTAHTDNRPLAPVPG